VLFRSEIQEVCRSGYDTTVVAEEDDELHFLGTLGTARQRVPVGMRGTAPGGPPAVFSLVECKADVDRALLSLKPHYRCLLLAFYADGYSLSEIAWQGRVSHSTVKSWRKRALKKCLNFLVGVQLSAPSQ